MIHNPRKCGAFHSACENVRDYMAEKTITGFGLSADKNGPKDATLTELDEIAEGYVRDGMAYCTCPPLFTHDCTGCKFLGTYEGRDLYVCNQGGTVITVIARRSSEGSDYESGWFAAGRGHNDHLAEARHRAEANGYRG